jgi:hypothetical protein
MQDAAGKKSQQRMDSFFKVSGVSVSTTGLKRKAEAPVKQAAKGSKKSAGKPRR